MLRLPDSRAILVPLGGGRTPCAGDETQGVGFYRFHERGASFVRAAGAFRSERKRSGRFHAVSAVEAVRQGPHLYAGAKFSHLIAL